MKKLSLSELGYGCYEFDSRRIRLHYFVSEFETKESFVTRTNALLAGTLIYNR